jgi:ATP-dependent Clp protease ATP-binding subunit ClpB
VAGRIAEKGITIELTDDAKTLIGNLGYDPAYGARPLKRVIQQRVENPLASRILKGEFGEGDTIKVDADPAKHNFTFSKS